MWSWVLHRITGVLTFFFLFTHVLDNAMLRVSPDAFEQLLVLYKNPIMAIGEIGLIAAVCYHALNGIRVMLVDFWSKGAQYQRVMLWVVLILWVLLVLPSAGRIALNFISEL